MKYIWMIWMALGIAARYWGAFTPCGAGVHILPLSVCVDVSEEEDDDEIMIEV